ncbi:MAG: Rrf2 family transcriptional regulator [Chitinophagaceae bacterium]|nr:Rrf2 family transcriptional regulator [Chitinophagaceae bacterium]
MVFSKTFGYALRGVLYVALTNEVKPRVQLEEIAIQLSVPRHFLGKVMKKLVKEGVLISIKGPYGGFSVNETTLQIPLLRLIEITGEPEEFGSCVLRLRKCNAQNPCPMHRQIETLRRQWQSLLASTKIGDLLRKDQPDFIKSIATL